MNSRKKKLIVELIHHYAKDNGTESLIRYIASTNGMFDGCKELFDISGGISSDLTKWLFAKCQKEGVHADQFIASVRQVLSILFDDGTAAAGGHYEVLGLHDDATPAEVKAAYRKLSLQYHPDTAGKGKGYDPQKFIEINKAYNAIIDPDHNARQQPITDQQWDRSKKREVAARQRRTLIYWGAALFTCLLVVMVIGTQNVKKRAMIVGLTEDRGVFIPPEITGESDTNTNEELTVDDSPAINEEEIEASPAISLTVDGKEDKRVPITQEAEEEQSWLNVDVASFAKEVLPVEPTAKKSVVFDKGQKDIDGTEQAEVVAMGSVSNRPETTGQQKEKEKPDKTIGLESTNLEVETFKQRAPERTTVEEIVESNNKLAVAKVQKQPASPSASWSDYQERIEAFLEDYHKAYVKQDVEVFSNLFTDDAIENDVRFSKRQSVYRELFKKTKTTSLDISVINWRKTGAEIRLTGRFNVNLNYKNGKSLEDKGLITFILVQKGEHLRIHEMKYSFEN